MKNNKPLFAIFLVVFVDLLGFSLILPLLPYYAETFGATPTVIGLLVAIYAAAQLVGAPILGRLSDRYGRRPILLISILGNALGFLMLALATNLEMMFISRLLAGLTGGNISVAQAYISDVTDEKNRAKGLGLLGAAFGLGFIIGPALGGILSQWGFSVPSFLATAISTLNLILVFTWLPESLTAERKQQLVMSSRPALSPQAMLQALRRPFAGNLLQTRFFYGLAFSTFQSVFTLYAQLRFGLTPQGTGYILAYVGFLSVLTQGLLIGRLTSRFSDGRLMTWAALIMAAAFAGWAFAPSIPLLLIALAPIAIAGGVLNTVINSAISKSVKPMEIGGMLGLAAALESLTRVIAPSMGGVELEKIGTWAPGVTAAVVMCWVGWYIWRYVACKECQPVPETQLV
jgi:DHA1 family tetracycline resistance protein-like MFS transporter